MTYFGNARLVYETKLVYSNPIDFGYDNRQRTSYDPTSDCQKAEEYYRKAMELSVDKEFKAKCCFMAAKCEQNTYFNSAEFSNDRPIRSGKYFKQLQENFSSTKYYKEVLNECGYFEVFRKQWLMKYSK